MKDFLFRDNFDIISATECIEGESMIKAVVFDLYGTLVDIKTDEDNESLWQEFGEQVGKEGKQLKSDYIRLVAEKESLLEDGGEIDLEEVFNELGIASSMIYTFRTLSREKLHLYDGVKELIEHLAKNNIRSILLSNAQRTFTQPEIELLGLDQLLDVIYLSSDVGYKKPSKNFFKHMLEKEMLNSNECIFVGNDSRCDIEGAENMGMSAVYIHTDCSPDVHKPLGCFKVMDGDFTKVTQYFKAYQFN